jgi:hypothetical protein
MARTPRGAVNCTGPKVNLEICSQLHSRAQRGSRQRQDCSQLHELEASYLALIIIGVDSGVLGFLISDGWQPGVLSS